MRVAVRTEGLNVRNGVRAAVAEGDDMIGGEFDVWLGALALDATVVVMLPHLLPLSGGKGAEGGAATSAFRMLLCKVAFGILFFLISLIALKTKSIHLSVKMGLF
jgi:hypothetical protein